MTSVFILEDDDERKEVFKNEIFPRGFEITFISSYDDAVNVLSNNKFDILLLDRDLGNDGVEKEKTGEDVAKWIAENQDIVGNPIIVIHSWNIPGAVRMQNILSNFENYQAPFYGKIFQDIIKQLYNTYSWR